MKSRLEEIPELAGKVVVFRRSDIETEFEKRMAKVRGRCVVVRLMRGKNTSRDKLKPRFGGSYSVALFSSPLLTQRAAKDSDSLMEEMVAKLNGWWPPEVPSNGAVWFSCDAITFPEDPEYDVTLLTVEVP